MSAHVTLSCPQCRTEFTVEMDLEGHWPHHVPVAIDYPEACTECDCELTDDQIDAIGQAAVIAALNTSYGLKVT